MITVSYAPDIQPKHLWYQHPYTVMETEESLTVWQRSGAMTREELGILPYRPAHPFVGV